MSKVTKVYYSTPSLFQRINALKKGIDGIDKWNCNLTTYKRDGNEVEENEGTNERWAPQQLTLVRTNLSLSLSLSFLLCGRGWVCLPVLLFFPGRSVRLAGAEFSIS
jgi:hypothetical protein